MAVDDLSVYVDLIVDEGIVIEYKPDRSVKMALDSGDFDIVAKLIQDPNFWTQFLQSLSSALTINKG